MSVVESVRRDLEAIRRRDPGLADGTLAASALELAAQMDGDNSATSKSMCAKALMETMDRLMALAPEEAKRDGVDELQKVRVQRQRRVAASES